MVHSWGEQGWFPCTCSSLKGHILVFITAWYNQKFPKLSTLRNWELQRSLGLSGTRLIGIYSLMFILPLRAKWYPKVYKMNSIITLVSKGKTSHFQSKTLQLKELIRSTFNLIKNYASYMCLHHLWCKLKSRKGEPWPTCFYRQSTTLRRKKIQLIQNQQTLVDIYNVNRRCIFQYKD